MLPLSNKNEAPEAQADRFPPCMFPASNLGNDSPSSRGHVKMVLQEQWSAIKPSLTNLGITLPAMVKAAWVLTLRCFVSVEIICFSYQNQIVVGNFTEHVTRAEHVRSNSDSLLYTIRVDCRETIQHFLHRLERSRTCLVVAVAAPTGYDIRVVEEPISHRLCNTVPSYHEHELEELQPMPRSDSVVSRLARRLGMNRVN